MPSRQSRQRANRAVLGCARGADSPLQHRESLTRRIRRSSGACEWIRRDDQAPRFLRLARVRDDGKAQQRHPGVVCRSPSHPFDAPLDPNVYSQQRMGEMISRCHTTGRGDRTWDGCYAFCICTHGVRRSRTRRGRSSYVPVAGAFAARASAALTATTRCRRPCPTPAVLVSDQIRATLVTV